MKLLLLLLILGVLLVLVGPMVPWLLAALGLAWLVWTGRV